VIVTFMVFPLAFPLVLVGGHFHAARRVFRRAAYFLNSAITSPSRTITAPNGKSASRASSIAMRMNATSSGVSGLLG
jgi:hypothetical protein